MRGGTGTIHHLHEIGEISIHPPRAGWDNFNELPNYFGCNFNPPTPCGVGLSSFRKMLLLPQDFNPPTPCGVGLLLISFLLIFTSFQSTHPVRGGTEYGYHQGTQDVISIHPPRAGWDARFKIIGVRVVHFNPPTPCGVGQLSPCPLHQRSYFNPPTPCGVGLSPPLSFGGIHRFQSTHPVRGGTPPRVAVV